MIKYIKEVANEVGINTIFSNSEERIETQLNRLTREEDVPIMLIAWDIDTNLEFDTNGFLKNPSSNITAILVRKPEDLTSDMSLETSLEMVILFQKFIQKLNDKLKPLLKDYITPLSNITYKLIPKYGAGKHSGIFAKWNQKNVLEIECLEKSLAPVIELTSLAKVYLDDDLNLISEQPDDYDNVTFHIVGGDLIAEQKDTNLATYEIIDNNLIATIE